MKITTENSRRKLSLSQALIICGIAFALYKLFRSPELDKEIDKISSKLGKQN